MFFIVIRVVHKHWSCCVSRNLKKRTFYNPALTTLVSLILTWKVRSKSDSDGVESNPINEKAESSIEVIRVNINNDWFKRRKDVYLVKNKSILSKLSCVD